MCATAPSRSARPVARGGAGRDRRADRPERRREVVDAARDHGRRARSAAATCGSAGARSSAAAPRTSRAAGVALVPRAAASSRELTVEENLGSASPRGAAATAAARLARVYELFPIVHEFRTRQRGRALRRPAAAARDRARARRGARTSCCSTSRRSGSRRRSSTSSSSARRDPRARPRGAARRAARAADGRARRPHARARERRAAADARPGGRGRHRPARRRRTSHDARVLNIDWQTLADALALGGIYALMAVGIGLVFGVLRLVNFAYGQLIMAGAYALAFASEWGWPRWLGDHLLLRRRARAVGADGRLVFRPLRTQSPAVMLVATFAVAFLLQSIALLAFGPLGKIAASLAPLNRRSTIAGVDIRKIAIVAIVVTASACSLLQLLLTRTTVGLQMRAASMDFRTARHARRAREPRDRRSPCSSRARSRPSSP